MTAENVLVDTVLPHIAAGVVPGAVVGILRNGEMSSRAMGFVAPDGRTPMTVDIPVRISSITKPIVAALALMLVEDGTLAIDDPVERFGPELANRRVLRAVDGPVDDTVPACRPPTVEDLWTMRLGFGFVLDSACPAVEAAATAGLGIGPPDPSIELDPDAWISRFAELPLLEQPGTTWRYDLAYAVLGVVLAR